VAGVVGPGVREWEERGEDRDGFLPGPRSVRTGVICLALLATVLENNLLEMEEVAVGDLVALLDLPVLGSMLWAIGRARY